MTAGCPWPVIGLLDSLEVRAALNAGWTLDQLTDGFLTRYVEESGGEWPALPCGQRAFEEAFRRYCLGLAGVRDQLPTLTALLEQARPGGRP
jgi:hypothetical protein